MSNVRRFGDVEVTEGDDFVAIVEIQRGPNNFFDQQMIADLADAMESLDTSNGCRASVLCSQGKNFCAGANLHTPGAGLGTNQRHLYDETVRLFSSTTPVVAAIQGAAIGGGLGLALWPDFRIGCPESRFSANFARLGFHQGFGITVTLPAVVGNQKSLEMLYTGCRLKGAEALAIGLCDELVELPELRTAARARALEIARSAPLAIESIRSTMRGDLPSLIRAATDREKSEQERLMQTDDFREGIAAMTDRRLPKFVKR
jgi:2-(1,2-epoxy-1,2-dihydrophenyl)acetyl-CoA isomerase